MKTLLVTCGATVPFPKLISVVVSFQFIEELKIKGFERMIVQFGKDFHKQFVKQLNNGRCLESKSSLTEAQLGTTAPPIARALVGGHFEIIGIDFSSEIQNVIIRYADFIISHAGTGSILDSVRLGKPIIVCVNDGLMNNHQQQIAEKFESYGYIWSCKATLEGLISCLVRSESLALKPFQTSHNQKFQENLELLAFQ